MSRAGPGVLGVQGEAGGRGAEGEGEGDPQEEEQGQHPGTEVDCREDMR